MGNRSYNGCTWILTLSVMKFVARFISALIGLNSATVMTEVQAPISQTEILAGFLFAWKKDNKSSTKEHAAHWRIQVNFWGTPNPILQGVISREVIHLLTLNPDHAGMGLWESMNTSMNICLIHKVQRPTEITNQRVLVMWELTEPNNCRAATRSLYYLLIN